MSASQIAVSLGLLGSGLMSGAFLSFTPFAIAMFDKAPAPVAIEQWSAFFERGGALMPPFALMTMGSFGYAAYDTGNMIYAASAALAVGIVPWTAIMMSGTIRKLQGLKAKTRKEDASVKEGDVKGLIWKYGQLNVGRGLFPAAAFAVAIWGTVMGSGAAVAL